MPDINAILEAERRGILPTENLVALQEARKRGLIDPQGAIQASPPAFQQTPGPSTPASGVPFPTPEEEFGEIREQPAPSLGEAALTGLKNLPQGITQEIIGIGSVLAKPLQTAESFGMLAKGLYSSLTGGDEPEEKLLNAVVEDFKSRWGSYDQFKFALAEQPARILGELSVVVGGAAGLASKGAKLGGAVKIAKGLETTAKVGRALDPLRITGMALSPITKAFTFGGKKIAANLLSGSGDEFLEQAYRASPGKPRFLDALRGKIPMSEFLDDVQTSLTKAKDIGRNNYNTGLAALSNIDDPITFSSIQKNFIDNITSKKFNVKLAPSKPAGLDFADSVFSDARDLRTIRAVKRDIDRWASVSANQTGRGLDTLKRRIDAKFVPNSVTRAVTSKLRNEVKDTIVKNVKGYKELTAESQKFINLLDDFQDVMSARSTSKANATLGKLTRLMRKDNEFAQTIVREMDNLTGGQLIATASGLAGRKLTSRSMIGRDIQRASIVSGLLGYADAKIGITALMSSPRITAEFLNAVGKISRGIQKTQQAVGASIPASITLAGRLQGITSRQQPRLSELE
jgi:hypothetical protein